jgi:hypothetical protein
MTFGAVVQSWQERVYGGAMLAEETEEQQEALSTVPRATTPLPGRSLQKVRVVGTAEKNARDLALTLAFHDGSERLIHLGDDSSTVTTAAAVPMRLREVEVPAAGDLPPGLRAAYTQGSEAAGAPATDMSAAMQQQQPQQQPVAAPTWALSKGSGAATPSRKVSWAADTAAAFSSGGGGTAFGLQATVPPPPGERGVFLEGGFQADEWGPFVYGADADAVRSLADVRSLRTTSLLDTSLAMEAVHAAVAQLEQLLVAALLPVELGLGGAQAAAMALVPEARVHEHVPCQKGEATILAEHRVSKPHPLEWVPPDAPPQRYHRLADPRWQPGAVGAAGAGQSCRLGAGRQRAVDDFVLSRRVEAAARGCSVEELAVLLSGRWGTQPEQLRALFRWVVEHIALDVVAFGHARRRPREGRRRRPRQPRPLTASQASAEDAGAGASVAPSGQGAREVLRRRRAAGGRGFAGLLHAMCRAAGLQSFLVQGAAKGWGAPKYAAAEKEEEKGKHGRETEEIRGGVGVVPNHWWNAVYLSREDGRGGGWHLLDPAWAAGQFEYGVAQRAATRYRRQLCEQFWLMSPQRALADHLPADEAWQLLDEGTMQSPTQWQQSVYRTPAFFERGLKLQTHAEQGTVTCADVFDVALSHNESLGGCFTCLLLPYEESVSRRIGDKMSSQDSRQLMGSTTVRSTGGSTTVHLRFPTGSVSRADKGSNTVTGPRQFELGIYCATARAVSYYACASVEPPAGLALPAAWGRSSGVEGELSVSVGGGGA